MEAIFNFINQKNFGLGNNNYGINVQQAIKALSFQC